jgi:hypothetical protein
MTQASNSAAGVPLVAPASTAIDAPSGEMARPPRLVRLWISSVVDAVKFCGSPPLRNRTHTSVGPRAFDRYAIHFPSGEIAAPDSKDAPCVSCVTRENSGARVAVVDSGRAAMRARTAAAAAATKKGQPNRCPVAGACVIDVVDDCGRAPMSSSSS